ncbi:MAG: hypothetical protein ACRDIB_03745 [Ardenticatenaceae bacterium]
MGNDAQTGEETVSRLVEQKPLSASLDTELTLAQPNAARLSQPRPEADAPPSNREAAEESSAQPDRTPPGARSQIPTKKATLMRSDKSAPRRQSASRGESGAYETAVQTRSPNTSAVTPSTPLERRVQEQFLSRGQSHELPTDMRPPGIGNEGTHESPIYRKFQQEGIAQKLNSHTPPNGSDPANNSTSRMTFRRQTQELTPHTHDETSFGPSKNGKNGHSRRTSGKDIQRAAMPATPEALNAAFQLAKNSSSKQKPKNANGMIQRAIAMPEPSAISDSSPDKQVESNKMGYQEFEALASKVYKHIKQKLEKERERHGRHGLSLRP